MTDWSHSIIEILGVVIPLVLYIASNKYSAKKENEKRHAENTRRLDELVSEREYLKPHDHIEREGPLMVQGIIRKRKNGP